MRRRIGLKVLELGGNAVIGYKQYFDLEGESGIVVRVRQQFSFPVSIRFSNPYMNLCMIWYKQSYIHSSGSVRSIFPPRWLAQRLPAWDLNSGLPCGRPINYKSSFDSSRAWAFMFLLILGVPMCHGAVSHILDNLTYFSSCCGSLVQKLWFDDMWRIWEYLLWRSWCLWVPSKTIITPKSALKKNIYIV